ncbi:unnamed protein product [Paramecium pentaurelia]|uniref:WD-40 repeat protein n=1 Tax=Paramecium pentaurelia TaxID=43138 RepID=A0A8S1X7J0_9CILI|nr:unnamed protein product [Paramecium pentaurelia]
MSDQNEHHEDLQQILAKVKDVDESIYHLIIEMLRKEKISDCIEFPLKVDSKMHKTDQVNKNFQLIAEIAKNIKNHNFNKYNYNEEIYFDEQQKIIQFIQKKTQDSKIIPFFKFLVLLTAIDKTLVQCGSNSLNLLVRMKVDLRNQNFENIRIENSSLVGANFVKCNLSGSEFQNVEISGMNLNGAELFNCKWNNLKIHKLNKLDGHTWSVLSVCFSPDGTMLASGSRNQPICLWDFRTGQQKAQMYGHIYSVSFSNDGTLLASGSKDKSILLWDVKTGEQKAKFVGHAWSVYSVYFSPDGYTLASGGHNSIRIWDLKTGQKQNEVDGHSLLVSSVCFSSDGVTLASDSDDNSIRLWDVKTGKQKAKLDGHVNGVRSVKFSPDSNVLASGSLDNSIRLWDVKTRKEKAQQHGHSSGILSVCFSPDGTTLASGSQDCSIRLWNVKTGKQQAQLDGHNNWILSVCFSPDGTTLAFGSSDNSISLWDVKDVLNQYQSPLQQNRSLDFEEDCGSIYTNLVNSYITILLISQQPKEQKYIMESFQIIKGQIYFSYFNLKDFAFFKANQNQNRNDIYLIMNQCRKSFIFSLFFLYQIQKF